MLLVFWIHFDLIISREAIHEGHPLKTIRIVNYDICDWKRKLVFGISNVQVVEVDADSNLLILLKDKNNVGNSIRMLLLSDETRVYELSDF